MTGVNIYLNFNGNCEEAFNFYKSVFGGEFAHISRFNEMPPVEGMPAMDAAFGNKIMHMTLQITPGIVIMGSDTGGEWAKDFKMGNNFSISVNTDSKKEADNLYEKLQSGGKIIMPMGLTFWGSYFAMLTDQFGVNWMISAPNE